MTSFSSYEAGHFCWVDLMSRDINNARTFYTSLFEWEAIDQDTQGGPPYTIFQKSDAKVAGLGEMSEDMKQQGLPPMWNSYISVNDIDEATSKASANGGQVMMPPMQVLDAGRMSIVADPTGAAFSLWQPLAHFGASVANETGTWVWNEVLTPEPERAVEYYQAVFDWEIEKEEASSPNDYWMISNKGRHNGGIMLLPENLAEVPPHWSVYFAVEDIQAAVSQVKHLGGSIYNGPFEVSVGHIAVAADTDGGGFHLIQLTVPVDE